MLYKQLVLIFRYIIANMNGSYGYIHLGIDRSKFKKYIHFYIQILYKNNIRYLNSSISDTP